MARGWESKSVESQQAEAEARRDASNARPLTDADREREVKRLKLGLSRARVLQDLVQIVVRVDDDRLAPRPGDVAVEGLRGRHQSF